METKDLLLEHFLAWQSRAKEKKTLRQFSELIGMTPQQLNHYWTGKRNPPLEVAEKFYITFGDERFFSVAGYQVPDHRLQFINTHWEDFSDEDKEKIMEFANQYKARPRKRNATSRPDARPVE